MSKTNSDTRNVDLAATLYRLERIRSNRVRIATRAAEIDERVPALVHAADASRVASLLDGTSRNVAAAEKARDDLNAAVVERDDLNDGVRLLDIEAEPLVAAIRAAEEAAAAEANAAAFAAALEKLRLRAVNDAPAVRAWLAGAIALTTFESHPGRLFEERVPSIIFAALGTTARALINDGRDLAARVRSGEKEV